MCGIAGFYSSFLPAESYPGTIRKMLSLIRHRGPDETGYYLDDRVAIGTARLRVIDFETGSQPLSDRNGRFWLCYNGELYNYSELRAELERRNHVFVTRSDTEVVLEAWVEWGEECLPRFNGAFALAIYDTVEGELFLARDRFGERPLFYVERAGEFLFASEMKAFLGYEGISFDMDPQQLASIFAVWTPLPHQTAFKNVRQLPVGSSLSIKYGRSTQRMYDTLKLNMPPFDGSESEAVERCRSALAESVRLRLRSDVEVAVYLSGGLDSSIVTLLASQLSSRRVRTFSVQFEDAQFDESADQLETAGFVGTDHAAITVSCKDIADNFPMAVFHAEVPAFRTALVPMFLLSKHVSDSGIKVVLTGEGADEAFLGYDLFKETLLRVSWNQIGNEERKAKLARLYPYLGHFGAEHHSQLMGLYQRFSEETMPGLFSHEMRFQNGRFATRLLNTQADPFDELLRLTHQDPYYVGLTAVQKAQWLEYRTLLPGYLLSSQGERMSLAHGVENRCPFLDPNVVQFASSVNLRFDDGFNEKYLLKRAFEDRLPNRVIVRHKHPYRAPDSVAFVKHPPDYLDLLLSETELRKIDVLDIKFALALTKKIMSTPAEKISTRENQAFVFLVSTALLHHLFVKRTGVESKAPPAADCFPIKVVDKRNRY